MRLRPSFRRVDSLLQQGRGPVRGVEHTQAEAHTQAEVQRRARHSLVRVADRNPAVLEHPAADQSLDLRAEDQNLAAREQPAERLAADQILPAVRAASARQPKVERLQAWCP